MITTLEELQSAINEAIEKAGTSKILVKGPAESAIGVSLDDYVDPEGTSWVFRIGPS